MVFLWLRLIRAFTPAAKCTVEKPLNVHPPICLMWEPARNITSIAQLLNILGHWFVYTNYKRRVSLLLKCLSCLLTSFGWRFLSLDCKVHFYCALSRLNPFSLTLKNFPCTFFIMWGRLPFYLNRFELADELATVVTARKMCGPLSASQKAAPATSAWLANQILIHKKWL